MKRIQCILLAGGLAILVWLAAVLPSSASAQSASEANSSPLPKGAFARLPYDANITVGTPSSNFSSRRILHLAFREGGRELVSVSTDWRLRFWDVATGACRLPADANLNSARWVSVSPDGRLGAALPWGEKGPLCVWDIASARVVCELPVVNFMDSAAFSWDGRFLASASPDSKATVWEVPSGRVRGVIASREIMCGNLGLGLAVAPDGKMVASGRFSADLCEVSAVECKRDWAFQFPDRANNLQPRAFSRDGRRLAVFETRALKIWDLVGDGNAAPLEVPSGCHSAVFSPDGNQIAVGCDGGSIFLYHVPPPQPVAPSKPSAGELDALWRDLCGRPADAYRAGWALVRAGPAAVEMIRGKLKPLPAAPPPGDPAKMLADLDSDDFRVREAATKGLAALGDEKILRDSLAKAKSVEVQARIEAILADITNMTLHEEADFLSSRAVRVLELIAAGRDDGGEAGASAAALGVLKSLAAGGPGRQTREAAAALVRLGVGTGGHGAAPTLRSSSGPAN